MNATSSSSSSSFDAATITVEASVASVAAEVWNGNLANIIVIIK
tara:strand:+ start:187 stop:318 length:132 start_codon:yes stop_codon:yes gene_type:complete